MATFKMSEHVLADTLGITENSDKLREELGSVWVRDQSGKLQMHNSTVASTGKFTKIEFGDVTINQEYESAPYYSLTQSIVLKSTDAEFENYTDFINFINGSGSMPPVIVTGSSFMDASISLPVPYSPQELKLIENSARPLSYMASPVYNFYQRNYENKIVTTPEQILPNLYSVYNSKNDGDLSPNAINDFDSELINLGNLFGDIVGETATSEPPDEIEVLPIENIEFLKEANPYKRVFPMYNEIEFSTDTRTIIAETMADADLSTSFLKFLTENGSGPLVFEGFREELSVNSDGQVVFVASPSNGTYETYDAFEWIQEIAKQLATPGSNANTSFIGPAPKEENKFVKFFNFLKFEAKVQKIVNKYLRSYKDVLDGIPSYSETVAYKVEKRKAGKLITTYLFPNSNEVEVYKFVDTQVKYGEKYDYSAYAYQLFMGAEYMYKDLELSLKQRSEGSEPFATIMGFENKDAGTTTGGSSGGGSGGSTPGGNRPAGFGGFVIEEPGSGFIEPDDPEDENSDIGASGFEFSKEEE